MDPLIPKHCAFCSKIIPIPTYYNMDKPNTVKSHIWNYLYHQNVRETLPPVQSTNQTISEPIPRLTFALSVPNTTEQQVNTPPVCCQKCTQELAQLTKLHTELEQTKYEIDNQVKRLGEIRKVGKLQHPNEYQANLWSFPKEQMLFAGSTIGAENITRSLGFLGGACKSMVHNSSERQAIQNAEIHSGLTETQPVLGIQKDHLRTFCTGCSLALLILFVVIPLTGFAIVWLFMAGN